MNRRRFFHAVCAAAAGAAVPVAADAGIRGTRRRSLGILDRFDKVAQDGQIQQVAFNVALADLADLQAHALTAREIRLMRGLPLK